MGGFNLFLLSCFFVAVLTFELMLIMLHFCFVDHRLKKKRQLKQSQSEKADAEQNQSDLESKTPVIREPAPIGQSQERNAERERSQTDGSGEHSDTSNVYKVVLVIKLIFFFFWKFCIYFLLFYLVSILHLKNSSLVLSRATKLIKIKSKL